MIYRYMKMQQVIQSFLSKKHMKAQYGIFENAFVVVFVDFVSIRVVNHLLLTSS